jgi:hypothetical protein
MMHLCLEPWKEKEIAPNPWTRKSNGSRKKNTAKIKPEKTQESCWFMNQKNFLMLQQRKNSTGAVKMESETQQTSLKYDYSNRS